MSRKLNELCRLGHLARIPVQLGPRDLPMRRLYWTAEFEKWCRTIIQSQGRSRTKATLDEQLNQAFADFVTGRPLTGMTKCDPPKGQAIWRLKTPDLRLYGWADEPQCMVLVAGEFKSTLMLPGPPKDRHLGAIVVAKRKSLGFSQWTYGEIFNVFPKSTG